ARAVRSARGYARGALSPWPIPQPQPAAPTPPLVLAQSLLPSSPSCRMNMLHAFDRAHVLSTFERRWIRTLLLAHAALHLPDGFVFVLFHPLAQLTLYVANVVDAVAHERGAEHGDVGPHHQELHNIFRIVNAAGRGQVRFDATEQDSDPGQRQPQRLRRA